MSVSYTAMAGYGFFTDILKTNWANPETRARQDIIWDLLPQNAKSYYGKKSNYFEDDFDHETLYDMVKERFSELEVQWYGNPYSKNIQERLFIAVKSTWVESSEGDKPIDMSQHSFISAAARAQLTEIADLFFAQTEPRWFTWLQVG